MAPLGTGGNAMKTSKLRMAIITLLFVMIAAPAFAAEWPTSFRGQWNVTFRSFEIIILTMEGDKVTGEYRYAGNPLDPRNAPSGGVRPLEGTIDSDNKMSLRFNSNVIIAIYKMADGSFEIKWEEGKNRVPSNYAKIPAPIKK
jgi:hypothetical protein